MKAKTHVLIDEPDRDIQTLYEAIFCPGGTECHFVNDVDEIDAALASDSYALVIVNHGGLQESGLERVQEINHNHPHQPVLLVSSIPIKPSMLKRISHISSNFYMPKPFDINHLRDTVELAHKQYHSLDPHAADVDDMRVAI